MTDSEILEKNQQPFPVHFKVIGVGTGATDIIKKVKSFGYDCIGCILAENPSDCIPTDDDKMVIIVARDNKEVANAIARTYHDADILTIGVVRNADITCYDSVMREASGKDYLNIVETLLQPIVSVGFMHYDFRDLQMAFKDKGLFKILIADGKDVVTSVNKMKSAFDCDGVDVSKIETTSALLYLNRQKQPTVTMKDMLYFCDMLNQNLPESVHVIWAQLFDDTLPDDLIRFTIIMSGKYL